MVFDGGAGVRFDRQVEDRRVDERVAVAVAADPRTHRDHRGVADRRAPALGGKAFDVADQFRDDLEDARPVVAQGFVDLVGDPQLGQSHDGGLPEGEDREQHGTADEHGDECEAEHFHSAFRCLDACTLVAV